MKKITEYKELDAATFDNSRLPLKNCVFYNSKHKPVYSEKGTLRGITKNGFLTEDITEFHFCSEIIERYPRKVPEEVAKLPDDKPFLAYMGTGDTLKLNSGSTEIYEYRPSGGEGWTGVVLNKHSYTEEEFKSMHFAIDVSTPWAAENFTEIVEAMEYEAIKDYCNYPATKAPTIAHKLGDKTYDLNFNRTDLLPEDVFGKEVENKPRNPVTRTLEKDIVCKNLIYKSPENKEKKVEETKPLDWETFKKSAEISVTNGFVSNILYLEEAFYAGKARGKWEASKEYQELLYEVQDKIPGETRHETALRLIKQSQQKINTVCENRELEDEK